MTCDENEYTALTDDEYKEKFGIGTADGKKLKAAYKKAWEIRNFEIDKFWTRVAYFWGFIAVIFAGYISVITGDDYDKIKDLNLDFYLILLGLIFSVAWLLVIKGSKRWQDNWEAHIDRLEDDISGPLYKTIYCKNKNFYSVSGINELLAWVVIGVWTILLLQYIFSKFDDNILQSILTILKVIDCNDFFAIIALLLTAICIFCLLKKCFTSGFGYKTDLSDGSPGKFIGRND
jgi:hypothetical protein